MGNESWYTDVWIQDFYVSEVPKSHKIELPNNYAEIPFSVPIISREGATFDDKVDMAVRHYIEKRGHPGRDRMLVVYLNGITSRFSEDTPMALRLNH